MYTNALIALSPSEQAKDNFHYNQSLEEAVRDISHEGTNRHLTELTDPPQSTYRYKGIGLSESNIYKQLDRAADCCQALFLKSTKCAVQRERWKGEVDISKKQSISDLWSEKLPSLSMSGNTSLPITSSGSAGADNLLFHQHCSPLSTVGA